MNALMTLNQSKELTMSSREIAEIVESRHDSVKRAILRLMNKGVIRHTPLVNVKNNKRQTVSEYRLNKRDTYVIVAQLSPEFTARLVDRWQELEQQNAIKAPTTLKEALFLAYKQQERIEQLQLENKQKDKEIEIMKPKTEKFELWLNSDGTIPYTKLYKNVNVEYPDLFPTRNDFFEFLNKLEILYHSKTVKDGKTKTRIQIYTKASRLGLAKVALIDDFKKCSVNT